MDTPRIAVVGAAGRLGRAVVARVLAADDLVLCAAIGRAGSDACGRDVGELVGAGAVGLSLTGPDDGFAGAHVVVDVSLPAGLRNTLEGLDGAALVTGVTGLGDDDRAALEAASGQGAVLHAANFAPGVHVLADLVGRAVRALPTHHVEIVETHHARKRDAPSGTARLLVDVAERARDGAVIHGRHGETGPRPAGEIGVHALRMGDVVGEHTVWLAGDGERLCLGHVATNRDLFAVGAVRAARWMAGRSAGRYTMRDVLGL